MSILPLSEIPHYENFISGPHKMLARTIADFLSVKVDLEICSVEMLKKKHGVDITENINRSLYEIGSAKVLLISHVEKDDSIYFLGLRLQGCGITAIRQNRILNFIAGAISKALAECIKDSFYNAPSLFNERIIQRMISSHLALGSYNRHIIYFLIDKARAMMTTTFESRHCFRLNFGRNKRLHI